MNFVLEGVLDGGVNESLGLDTHGKTLAFLLLGLESRCRRSSYEDDPIDQPRNIHVPQSRAAALAALALGAHAQTYPASTVRLMVPFAAGSATDQWRALSGSSCRRSSSSRSSSRTSPARRARSPRPRWRKGAPTATRCC